MNPIIRFRSFAPLLATLAIACSSQNPPPPVATPAASPALGAVPLDSRSNPAGSATAADGSQALPPGHPPIGGAPGAVANPHGAIASAGPGRSAGSITGTIALSPKLAAGATDVLYIMARKDSTTIAVRRVEAPAFPYAFEVAGSDAMMAGIDFVGPVDVVARLSRSGDAIPAKGDLEGTAKAVPIPAKDVRLTIDTVRQ